jgi:NADH-quinone oxidoreductase subunit A
MSRLVHPRKPGRIKGEVYECGIKPEASARERLSIRFYIIALLFVVFDVEAIFLFPWAVLYDQLLVFGLIEMGLFLGILIVGYYYAWKQRALEWV